MKPCENKLCVKWDNCHPNELSNCKIYGSETLSHCHIYNRLYKKKVPEKMVFKDFSKTGFAIEFTEKVNEIIDYLKEVKDEKITG